MINEIILLKIKTQLFLNKTIEQKLNSFILNYNKQNYIISLHHNLPVDSVHTLIDNMKLDIYINSCWSEVLIMNIGKVNIKDFVINYNIFNRIPKPDDILFIKTNDQRYKTTVIGYEFIPYDNISENLTIPYIKTKINESIENISGLSGSPVFIDNKIVGVLSKFNIKESILYIIPIYIIIKNLSKKDNTNIYGFEKSIKVTRINHYNINNDLFYHSTLKININIDTYLLLEGDSDHQFTIQEDKTDIKSDIITTPIKLNISNEPFIQNKERKYKITIRLLVLLKKMNVNKQTIICLFNHICKKDKDKDLWISFK